MCTMDSGLKLEQKSLINELTQGMEIAKQLRFHLNSASSAENRQLLLQRILSSYEKSLLILKSSAPTTGMTESSISGDGSPRSEDCNGGGFKDHHQDQNVVSKKRKVLPTWTDQVRISSENGFEGPIDDGYSWRKYGQKDILGTNHPRGYYRCTHRGTQGCVATKQVQKSDADPTTIVQTYRGFHTCSQVSQSARVKEEFKGNQNKTLEVEKPNQFSPEMSFSFGRAGLRVKTDHLDTRENDIFPSFSFPSTPIESDDVGDHIFCATMMENNLMDNYAPVFGSPAATFESDYLTVSPCHVSSFGLVHDVQTSESGLTEIISAPTSVTNSPIGDFDFSIDDLEFHPDYFGLKC